MARAPREPRVVAGLGRPETPEETRARKQESSRVYRSSQTFRNLIAAILATVGLVVVIVLAVPRGDIVQRDIDVSAITAEAEEAYDRPVIDPDVPPGWQVNAARVDASIAGVTAWTVVYAPPRGFVRLAQAFDTDEAWARSLLRGTAPSAQTEIDGRTWDVFTPTDREGAGNVDYAIGVQAGPDYVLLYGITNEKTVTEIADDLGAQLDRLEEQG